MRDALVAVANAVSEIVEWVDAPLILRVRMGSIPNAINHRVS